MTINVHNYGEFSPAYKVLTVKTLEDVSKNMSGFPPHCNLYMCKSQEDGLKLFEEQARKFGKILGRPIKCDMPIGYQSDYLFEFPDVVIVEELAEPNLKKPSEIIGEIAHEGGHVADHWKNQRLTFNIFDTLLTKCISAAKGEFEAENNALNARYSRQLLARANREFNEIRRIDYGADYFSFISSLGIMGIYAAFMQSNNPREAEKQSLKKLWDNFAQNKSQKPVRSLLQSKELKEHPEKFGDESFLEDFIFQKHYGWNFSFI